MNKVIVILSPNKDKVENTVKELNCDFKICDVANNREVLSAIEKIIKKHQRVDCLINNAGICIEGELDVNDAEKIKKVNVSY